MPTLDGGQERAIAGTQMLVAPAAFARVVNAVFGFALPVRITGIDAPEVRQQRDEPPSALVDAIPYAMRVIDFSP